MDPVLLILFLALAWGICRQLYFKFLKNKNGKKMPTKKEFARFDLNLPRPYSIDKDVFLEGKDTCAIAVIDTESTGLSAIDEPVRIGIILYLVTVKKGLKLAEIDRYYGEREPNVPINPKAAEVNGMTLEQLRGKRLDMPKIKALIDQADILVAHNAKFDYRMTSQIYEAVSKKIWACSIHSLKSYWRHYPNKKLDTLCKAFNIERKSPHNALSDCEALADLLFQHTGKTKQSATHMGVLIHRPLMPGS